MTFYLLYITELNTMLGPKIKTFPDLTLIFNHESVIIEIDDTGSIATMQVINATKTNKKGVMDNSKTP